MLGSALTSANGVRASRSLCILIGLPTQHKAGDKLFVDFTGKKLSIVDTDTGEIIAVEVFVAILGASGIGHPTVHVCRSGS